MTNSSMSNQVFWITGAGGALGACVAARLSNEGATVVASGRNAKSLPFGENVVPLPVDVTDDASVRAAATEIVRRFGRLDGLVTCTTLPAFGDFLDLDDESWRLVYDAKFMGSIRPIRAVLPHLIQRGRGRIVVLSGRGGLHPPPHHLPGATVNASLILLVKGLALRYGPEGLRINAVSPGPIESPRNTAIVAAASSKLPSTPLPGPGLPGDVADAVEFLLSERSRFISGTNLVIDGGGVRST